MPTLIPIRRLSLSRYPYTCAAPYPTAGLLGLGDSHGPRLLGMEQGKCRDGAPFPPWRKLGHRRQGLRGDFDIPASPNTYLIQQISLYSRSCTCFFLIS